MNYHETRRLKAIEKLGGYKCNGLSFIKGPDCPVPEDLLQPCDFNISHRVMIGGQRRPFHRLETEVLRMRKPEKKFILLCCLCNQRMRHIQKEFAFLRLPKRVIRLYESGWTLEQIAQEYDCEYKPVANFLRRNGVTIRPGARTGGQAAWTNRHSRTILMNERRTRHLTKERIENAKEMIKMYDDGDSQREIARWFGITKNAVRAHLGLDIK